jgi:hypothetical protein
LVQDLELQAKVREFTKLVDDIEGIKKLLKGKLPCAFARKTKTMT